MCLQLINNSVTITWSKEFFSKICSKSLWAVSTYPMRGLRTTIVPNHEDVLVDSYPSTVSIQTENTWTSYVYAIKFDPKQSPVEIIEEYAVIPNPNAFKRFV